VDVRKTTDVPARRGERERGDLGSEVQVAACEAARHVRSLPEGRRARVSGNAPRGGHWQSARSLAAIDQTEPLVTQRGKQ